MEKIGKMNLIRKCLEHGIEVPEPDQIVYRESCDHEYLGFELNNKTYSIIQMYFTSIDQYSLSVKYTFSRSGQDFEVLELYGDDGYYSKDITIYTSDDMFHEEAIEKFTYSSSYGLRELVK